MDPVPNCLFITNVEKEGPFLKVWGQTDKNTSLYIEQVLHSFTNQFDNGLCIPHPESLQIGILCCAKYKDNKYYRARITSLDFLHNRYIEVNFIDYGHKDVVPVSNIRSLESFETSFISIQPQAACFLLAEAVCPRGEWNDAYLDEICKEIRYTEVNFTIVAQVTKHYLVRLFVGVNDLAIILISKGLMRHTSLTTQEAVLLSMMPRAPMHLQQQTMQQNIATYKAYTLEPGSQYEVYVSYVTDGPCNFSVQLKQSEEVLGKLMKEINSMTLTPIEGIPIPGTVCLARCIEDGHICRAVVTNEVDGQFKVFYVDFGNFEVIPLEALYEIPFKHVIPKVMAIRFALAGVEKSTVTLEMQCAFKQFVDNRLIHMKVLPMTTRTSLPRCELWDPETQISALDIVNQAASAGYPSHITLTRGFSQQVKVSYVFSCNRFFVQLKSRQDELTRLMLDIQLICKNGGILPSNKIKVGMPCYALYDGDNQWYRSQIVEVFPGQVKVQYVDYGNEEVVSISQLKPIEGKQLTILRPQAIECCLNGYQNMDADLERDNSLEELILEQEFTMKVVEMQGKKALIELIDNSNYNVASLLLDKIAVKRSQVSPMLVQAGNKIEHRKSYLNNKERRNDRNENGRGSRNRHNDSSDSNDNTNWRQNNKGFNRNNDKNKREEMNDSTDSERHSNKSFGRNDRNRNDANTRNNKSWEQKSFNKSQNFRQKDDWNSNKDSAKKSDDWNNINDNSPTLNDNWGGDIETSETKGFNKRDNWNEKPSWNKDNKDRNFNKRRDNNRRPFNKDAESKEDNWGTRVERRGRDNFKNRQNCDEWNSSFKKKPDFKREPSELSSSSSEKSFRKSGFKDTSRNKSKPFNKFVKPKFEEPGGGGDSWQTSPVVEVPNPAPSSSKFKLLNVEKTQANIVISWFHNPAHFYCQIESTQNEFKQMMEDIQKSYKGRPTFTAVVGAPIIGLFPEDNVLYRAEVLEIIDSRYKVYYVDFGNVSIIDKVWPIELRFMELPAQAICCKLQGIEPPENGWNNANNYSQYFAKNQYFCRFLCLENDKTAVKLEYDNTDIGDLIVKDGLAKAILSPTPPDVTLMIGQQFRAMLLNVNSLADFTISLQTGFVLNCAVFNLSLSNETFEDNLKEKIGQILIVYVDDLKDDRLQVTLYDQTGTKIKLIDRDETAYENVELICPYLITNSIITGEVVHVDKEVYIQPDVCTQNLEYLLNAMYEYYENLTSEKLTPVEGYVYAVRGSDTNWYRGRVTKIEDDKVTVNYLDYGNSEDVEICNLKELTVEFMEIPIMCVGVSVLNASDELIGKILTVRVNFTEEGVDGVIEDNKPEECVKLKEPVESGNAQESVKSEVVGTLVVLSHTDSPSDFYLQLADSVPAIEDLQATLQKEVVQMPDLESPTVGVLCAAPYSVDQQWYRAQVLDADADITTVRFVDYGNTDVLDNHSTRVKTLSANLLSLEVHATRCRLKVKPIEDEWSTTAIQRFEELSSVESLTALFINQDEKTNYVELFSNGNNVGEVLINEGLAIADSIVSDTNSVGFVSHLNSPSEFWIQLENCVEELEWIAEQLSGAENFQELEDLSPGVLCAALFPDDQMWYRARILSNTVAGIEVLFVDYGNSCTSCSLRELPEDLIMLPALAQKCSLQKPKDLINWGPRMVKKFAEVAADGQTTFNVKKLSTGETAIVELDVDGVDVLDMIMPKTENVKIKNCESLNELILVKEGEEIERKCKLEELDDTTWGEESFQKFKDLNSEGGTTFQAEFVSEDTVRLYLNLNDIRLDLNGIKTPMSTPSKTRDIIKHSDFTGDDNDGKILVELITEELITDAVHYATTNKSDDGIVMEMVEGLVNDVLDKQNDRVFAESIIEDVVGAATNQSFFDHKLTNKSSSNDLAVVEDVVRRILKEVANESMGFSVVETKSESGDEDKKINENEDAEVQIEEEKFSQKVESTEDGDSKKGVEVKTVESLEAEEKTEVDSKTVTEGIAEDSQNVESEEYSKKNDDSQKVELAEANSKKTIALDINTEERSESVESKLENSEDKRSEMQSPDSKE